MRIFLLKSQVFVSQKMYPFYPTYPTPFAQPGGYGKTGLGGTGYCPFDGKGQGKSKGCTPEFFAKSEGRYTRDAEKVLCFFNSPIGQALMNGDAELIAVPKKVGARVKQSMLITPYAANEADWVQWGAQVQEVTGGTGCMSYDELWKAAGYEIKETPNLMDTMTTNLNQGFSAIVNELKRLKTTKNEKAEEEDDDDDAPPARRRVTTKKTEVSPKKKRGRKSI